MPTCWPDVRMFCEAFRQVSHAQGVRIESRHVTKCNASEYTSPFSLMFPVPKAEVFSQEANVIVVIVSKGVALIMYSLIGCDLNINTQLVTSTYCLESIFDLFLL